MALTKNDVYKVATLARIEISDEQAEETLGQLNKVFALIEEMQTVDTTDIEPMAHAQDISTRLRDDVVSEKDEHEALQSNAPSVERALFLVPKVIE